MRSVFILCLFVATPLSAEPIFSNSKVTSVVVYPQGAQVTREVEFTASTGAHDLLITDLPQAFTPTGMRLSADEGVQIGASVLRHDRLPPRDPVKPAAQVAAEAALEAATDGVTTAQLALDAVNARVDAAQAQIGYLSRLGASDAKVDAAVLQATSRMIGAEFLAASQAAIAARADFPAAERALKKAVEAQEKAQAALEALPRPAADSAALSLAIVADADGPHRLEVTHFVQNAMWMPQYELSLDRKSGQVTMDRALLVSQASGEDWTGVALTLSTAQPSTRAAASELWPQLHQIADPAPQSAVMEEADQSAGFAMERAPAPVVSLKTGVQFQGDIVVYNYPMPVDVANDVENLRLALDQIVLPAKVQARAIPSRDATAFMMAEVTNDSGQILLPGPAFLTRDGAVVGQVDLGTVAPGAKETLGFGAIEGLRLKRIIPARAEGGRGVFSKSNQIEQAAVLSVENLTAESWAVRVMDVIPYSQQEALMITFTADPAVTEQNVDDKRGVLAWDLTVPAGKTQTITLSTRESWPESKELHGQQY